MKEIIVDPFLWPEKIRININGNIYGIDVYNSDLVARGYSSDFLASGYSISVIRALGYSFIYRDLYFYYYAKYSVKSANREQLEEIVKVMLSRPIPQ